MLVGLFRIFVECICLSEWGHALCRLNWVQVISCNDGKGSVDHGKLCMIMVGQQQKKGHKNSSSKGLVVSDKLLTVEVVLADGCYEGCTY